MGYVVGRGRLMVGDTYREVGEAVPEAETWKNVASYLASGQLVGAPGDSSDEKALRLQVQKQAEGLDAAKKRIAELEAQLAQTSDERVAELTKENTALTQRLAERDKHVCDLQAQVTAAQAKKGGK